MIASQGHEDLCRTADRHPPSQGETRFCEGYAIDDRLCAAVASLRRGGIIAGMRWLAERRWRYFAPPPGNHGILGLTLKLTIQQKDQLSDLVLFGHAIFNGFAGVQHRAVIAATERIANLVERSLGMTPR